MRTELSLSLPRRLFLGVGTAAVAAVMTGAWKEKRHAAKIHVGPGCGCCHGWVEHVRGTNRFDVTVVEEEDIVAFKRKVGVPAPLSSCHTALIAGFVVEGHVPASDILRLIDARSSTIVGIAAPGMPLGSPGMEVTSGNKDEFEVLAFDRASNVTVFARH